jgi:hypothetical protein
MPPSPRHRHFLSDGFWRGAALNCRCPRTHRRFIEDNVYKLLLDGALQTPKIPKTISQLAVHFDFRIFPDSPKQKAQQGLGTASRDLVF